MKRQRRSLSVEHFQVVLGGFGKMTAWRVDMLRTRLRLRHTDLTSHARVTMCKAISRKWQMLLFVIIIARTLATVISLTYPRVFPG
jgi:hypothetical protein